MKPPRTISANGLDLIKSEENFSSRLYNDQAGHCTIGWGHLVHHGPICGAASERPFQNGITLQEGDTILHADLEEAEDAINKMCVGPLSQNEFDALCSFVFNLGALNFAGSTLLRLLNQQWHSAAEEEFSHWVYEGHTLSRGLVNRRRKEAALFAEPDA